MYNIKNQDGLITLQMPIVGAWYCHFIQYPDRVVDGNIGKWYKDEYCGKFIDEDWEEVNMIDDNNPCYLVRQY